MSQMENEESSATVKQLSPPYGGVAWYTSFFELLERVQIDKVDVSYLETNKIASGNEYKVVNGLRFLGLIDEKGNATDKMKSLKVVGDEYKKNLEKIVREAYIGLINKVDLEKAKPEDIINTLINEYGMARRTAQEGA